MLTAAALAAGGAALGALAVPVIKRKTAGTGLLKAAPFTAATLNARTLHRRAVEAVIWGVPAVAMAAFRKSLIGVGADYNQVVYVSKPLEARHEFITANNNTPYVCSVLDTRGGPVVLELPAASPKVALFGSAIDSFEVPLADVGPSGDDKGRGGKYLFLPPGYTNGIPDGYFVIRSTTYFLHVALRPIIGKAGTLDDAVACARTVKVYPLTDARKPQTTYVDAYPKAWKTLPVFDLSYFHDLAATIAIEPIQEKDAAVLGLLASIGIEKGSRFNPTTEQALVLDRAVKEAFALLQNRLTSGLEPLWADRQWGLPHLTQRRDFTFVVDGRLLVDERAEVFLFGTWLPKTLAASAYPSTFRDSSGELLSGRHTYTLHVPADTPARDFWSVIAYSLQTKSMIPNAQNRAGLSSYDASTLQVNDDGSVDVHVGPHAPAGRESNWIPTAGEDFFLMFRLYGPEKRFFDGTWKLPDVEHVK
jgi:hypothetical protein